MPSFVSDFLINSVLRQARRFSEISRSTFAGDGDKPSEHTNAVSNSGHIENPLSHSRTSVDSPLTRTISVSPQGTIVEGPKASAAMAETTPPRDRISISTSPRNPRRIPEDDGMQELRARIHSINARDISSVEKARLIHETLLEGYRASRTVLHVTKAPESDEPLESMLAQSPSQPLKFWQSQPGDATSADRFVLSNEDIKPTFVPVKQPKNHGSETPVAPPEMVPETEQPLGCQHYERNVKLQCFTCKKWYTCRFCHDANEDHNLVRRETKNMLCMICATPQKASHACISCGEIAAHYYCNICKLWENRQNRSIYHCNDCGICRRGMGLGKDFFHCKTCRACISTSIESSHKCIERSTDCDCPICGEYMFTSPRPVVFMPCGHSIHKRCYDQHMKVSYKCPICNKSLTNMESQFRNLDAAIQSQPMPPEFRDTTAVILCNDCSGKSTVRYHWLGLKCSICRSYNTVEININGGDRGQAQPSMTSMTEDGEPLIETREQQASEAPAEASSVSGNRLAPIAVNRRRHSSHGVEAQYRAPDRVARSVSPPNMGFGSIMAHFPPDGESDNDILRLWRGHDENSDASSSNDDSESDDGTDSPSEDDEDEDDDDDNEIVLIGHR